MSMKTAVNRTGKVGMIVAKIMVERDDVCVFMRSK